MKPILKQIAHLLTALLALYALLLAFSLLLVPRASVGERLDAGRAGASLYLTEPKYVLMARERLNTNADKAILLGASNMLAGFKQVQVQALVPGLEVHNLSVGGSNISQLSQIVDLVREVQSPEARRRDTYVIGLWYGMFAADAARWHTPDRHAGDTDIDIERYRYGFYRRTDAGPVANFGPRGIEVAATLIHPSLVLDRAARDATRSLRAFIAAKAPEITDAQRNAVVLSEAQRHKYLAFWRDYMGGATTLDAAQFQALERMVERIVADGGRVILVDMPIPRWHTDGAALAAEYQRRADALFARLRARAGVTVLAMRDADADADFSDEVHPKPRVTPVWAQRLATTLNILKPLSTSAGPP
jgi:hypothetical protein